MIGPPENPGEVDDAILDAPYEAEDLYNGETDDIWEKLDANDLIPILRNKFPKQIADFLARHNLKNNEGIGGTFAGTFIVPHFTFNNLILCILGPSIRKLLNEELLVDLHSSLQSLLVDDQAVALPVVQYLTLSDWRRLTMLHLNTQNLPLMSSIIFSMGFSVAIAT